MTFRLTARTLLQLGAELISSDSVAFYELIKNAFDAGSPRVDIDVSVRINHHDYLLLQKELRESIDQTSPNLEPYRVRILKAINPSAPRASLLVNRIYDTKSIGELCQRLEEANYIRLADRGHGMSLEDLQDIYLTVGTAHRQKQRDAQRRAFQTSRGAISPDRPILGEKGVGRLSAMRLGWRLSLRTTTKGETRWNRLDLDWRAFEDSETFLDDILVSTRRGRRKRDPLTSGTRIRIFALSSVWSKDKLKGIAQSEFSRFTDPFIATANYPINLQFNNDPINIPRFDRVLFDHAHASVEARYQVDHGEPMLSGNVDYKMRNREKAFRLTHSDFLAMIGDESPEVLRTLGPFSLHFYWFNRRILTAVEGLGDRGAVLALVNAWSGGLKVYRDGFRVNPYGSPNDDWLDLDRTALASSGYKVNRRQIVGVVTISSLANPHLIDQTNREGLRNTPEKLVLEKILKHVMEVQFRSFINQVDREVKAQVPVTFDELDERVEDQERQIRRNLNALFDKYPDLKADRQLVKPINDSIRQIRELMDEASQLADSYREGHSELTHLAGLGLMVEIVAHELNRATAHTLRVIADADKDISGGELRGVFETLGAQMRTLQRRLRILDPLATAARQRKEHFDLISWVQYIVDSHEAQFARHDVSAFFSVDPPNQRSLRVNMVKGMLVQILENLISNSMYWLKRQKMLSPDFMPAISLTLDTSSMMLAYTDNGPGIPVDRNAQIFQPFFTTKPPGEGHGLGLYISRELAKYNDASLILSDEHDVHSDRLNTFLLILGET